jgi:hypothetical protein
MAAKSGEEKAKSYGSEHIKVLEGLEGVRHSFDVVELSRKIKKQGDILILSNELKVDYNSLKHAIEEGRILSKFPNIHKSKANPLARLKTDRELIKFAELYNVYKTPVRKLYSLVKEWNRNLENDPFLILPQEERDLFIGSLLGDASIRKRDKTSCFRISHSVKQKEYLEWKSNLLKKFGVSEFNEVKRTINKRAVHMINFATETHHIFNYYRNLFYKNGRKVVTREILNQLTPRGLAIWICDDGSYDNKQRYIVLCTNAFTLEEHKLMKEFFSETFGLNPTIGFRDGKYYYLRFKKEDSKLLIEIIRPFIIESMIYKIGGEKIGSR